NWCFIGSGRNPGRQGRSRRCPLSADLRSGVGIDPHGPAHRLPAWFGACWRLEDFAMRLFAGWVRDTSGTSAVEFAILTPVFLLLLTGMLAYGIYFGAAHSLQQLAADAARIAIAGLDEDERDSLVDAFLDANADSYVLIERRLLDAKI